MCVMQRITIDGKDYKLVPVDDPFEHLDKGPEFSTLAAQEKADLYKSKYNDYKNIPRQELINRIIKIDAFLFPIFSVFISLAVSFC